MITAQDILKQSDWNLEYFFDETRCAATLSGPPINGLEIVFHLVDGVLFVNDRAIGENHKKMFQAIVYLLVCKIAEMNGFPSKYIDFAYADDFYFTLPEGMLTQQELEESDDLLIFAVCLVESGIPVDEIPHYNDVGLSDEITTLIKMYYGIKFKNSEDNDRDGSPERGKTP